MMDRASGRLLRCLGCFLAGLVRLTAWIILSVTARVIGMIAVLVLRIGRPFILWPLTGGMYGAAGAGVVFACSGAWFDALQAALAALIAGALVAAYAALAEHLDADFFRPQATPPWWWYS
jgi:hypothetical protein